MKLLRHVRHPVSATRHTVLCASAWLGTLWACALAPVHAAPDVSAPAPPRAITVVLDDNFPPLAFRDDQGHLKGLLKDRWDLWSRRTGVPVELKAMDWALAQQAMQDGEADVIDTIAVTEQRKALYDFSEPYITLQVMLFYHQSLSGIVDVQSAGAFTIGVKAGDACVQRLQSRGLDNFRLYSSYKALVDGAARSEVRVFCMNELPANHYLTLRNVAEEFRHTPPLYGSELRWAIHPQQPELKALLQQGFDLMTPAEREALREKWLGSAEVEGDQPLYVRYLGYVLTAGVLITAALLLWNRQLRNRVARRTAELTRTLRALEASKKAADTASDQLSATLGALPDQLFEISLSGQFVDIYAKHGDVLTVLPGQSIDDVMPPSAAQAVRDAMHEALQTHQASRQLIDLSHEGEPLWVDLSVALRPSDDAQQPASFIVLVRDVTARRMAENSAQRLARLYATMSRCDEAIVHSANQEELLQLVCHDAVVYGGMKMVWIGLIDAPTQLVVPVASFGEGTDYLSGLMISIEADHPLGQGPSGRAMRDDHPFWCQDFQNDPATAPWHERGRTYGWAASAAIPLHRKGQVIGAMTLYSGERHAFDEAAQSLLLKLATDIDFAIERFEQEAERTRMAEAIAESEEKYRELTESINDVIWSLDPVTMRFNYVSPSVVRLRGYTPEEIMAEPMDAALQPDDAARLRQKITADLAAFKAGQLRSVDFHVEEIEQPCKGGGVVWTEVVTNFVHNRKTGRIELRGVTRDVSERKKAAAQIQRMAHYDQLTGLPNRTLLKDQFRHAAAMAQRKGEHIAVMFLDLDHFKDINDTLGHDIGDQMLVQVAQRITHTLRASDTMARQGGDEFVLVLTDTDGEGALRVAAKLLEVVAQPYDIGPHQLRTSVSIGVSMFPEDGTDLETLSKNADAAMYQVKHDSRNGVRFFTQEMQSRSARTLMLANSLHQALDEGHFSLQYQPQISLGRRRVIGVEALLRWHHPELGAISPAEFIPIAESNGLILPIGAWVLGEACRQASVWRQQGLPPLVMAVNLSAVQFRQPDLTDLVDRVLRETRLPETHLELELTEAVAMTDPQKAVHVMDQLAERGVRLSIDDFGTGYSSLSYLKRFKVNRLKIDQSFVRDITDDPDDKAIVMAIIKLAHSLGVGTIAEGVETLAQLDFLRQQGCEEVQGYYFSRPLSAHDCEAFLRRPFELPTPQAMSMA